MAGAEWVEELGRFNNWTLTPLEWKKRYRVCKDAAKELCDDFWESGFCSNKYPVATRNQLGYDERVLVMLRYLSTGADFASTGDAQLKHCKTTVSHCVWEVVDFLYYNHERYIRWPQTPVELEQCARLYDVNRYNNKPLCMGAVDCTHIGIKKPNFHWQEEAFVNRKSFHSINTMLVVDALCRILHVDATFPGSASDAYIFNQSEIRDFGDRGFFGKYFLIADSGFRLRPYCFTPYIGTVRDLTPAQQQFNNWHASARSVVECTNGQLKQRFRVLDACGGLVDHDPDKISKLIVAACCLHNLCKKHNDPLPLAEDPCCQERPPAYVQPPLQIVRNEGQLAYRDAYVETYFH